MINTPNSESLNWLDWLVVFLIIGYLSMTQSFAHIGFSPLHIGEIALGTFIVAGSAIIVRPWLTGLVRSNRLGTLSWWIFIFLGYGLIQTFRGIACGYSTKIAIQNVVFNVYPLFIFVGLWVGLRHRELLPKLIRWIAWFNGVYGVVYLILLSRYDLIDATKFGGTVSWFGQPGGAAVALLGLLAFERDLKKVWVPALLNTFVLLGIQVRAEWLGLTACLLLWGYLTGRVSQLAKVACVLAGLLAIGWVADIRIPSPSTHAREISVRSMVGRALSAVDPKLAATITESSESWASTTTWRTGWWSALWDMVHEKPARAVVGPGYGYPIWDLHPEELHRVNRTPHNVFVYALSYTGWVGVVLFVGFQLCIAGLLWRVYCRTGQAFGICYWVMMIIWAFFDNLYETPFGAIPVYLLTGLALAPLLVDQVSDDELQQRTE